MTQKVYLLDSNLLVLLIVGKTSRKLIAKHKKTRAYQEQDYDLLLELLAEAREVIVTPNVLAETSNLLGDIADPLRSDLFSTFRDLIGATREVHVQGVVAASHKHFVRLGLTDAALLSLPEPSTILLTADFALYDAACRSGRPAENFNHIREAYL